MDCLVIGGFLGSGKTTLINNILKRLEKIDHSVKTALLINEFGEIPVDGVMVDSGSYSMREITGGCICCSLKGMLADAVSEIRHNENPDLLIVEATGLAVPSEIAASVGTAGGCSVYTLLCVDAAQYEKLAGKLAIYDRQLADADIVLLTKRDILSGALLETVRQKLANETAAAGTRCVDDYNNALEIILSNFSTVENSIVSNTPAQHVHCHHDKNELKQDICQVTHRLSGPVEIEVLSRKMISAAGKAGGALYRIKGIVAVQDGWRAVQFSDGKMNIRTIDEPENRESFIVLIGDCGIVREIEL